MSYGWSKDAEGVPPRALGHDLLEVRDVLLGSEAECECGELFRARWQTKAISAWAMHSTEEAQNRGT